MILEVISKHMRSKENLTHGQTLWMAVSVNNPPVHRQRIADTAPVPVLLELCTAEDLHRCIDRLPVRQRLLREGPPLLVLEQAYDQGGLLSNCDLAELINSDDSRVAEVLAEHECITGTLVPRRATLHAVRGNGIDS